MYFKGFFFKYIVRYIDVQDYNVFVRELTNPVLWKSFLHPCSYSLFWDFFLWCSQTGPAFLWLGLCMSSHLNSAFVGSSGLTQLLNGPDSLCALMGALGPLSLTVTIDMIGTEPPSFLSGLPLPFLSLPLFLLLSFLFSLLDYFYGSIFFLLTAYQTWLLFLCIGGFLRACYRHVYLVYFRSGIWRMNQRDTEYPMP